MQVLLIAALAFSSEPSAVSTSAMKSARTPESEVRNDLGGKVINRALAYARARSRRRREYKYSRKLS